jgi:predicted hydrocarbon binding protein
MALKRAVGEQGDSQQETYLTVDPETGEVRTGSGERIAVVSADLFGALCDAIHDKVGEEVRDVLYNAGVEWGRREYRKFKGDVEAEGNILYHLRNMGLNEFRTRFNDLLTRGGWGEFDIEQKHDFVIIHLYNSAYAEMVTQHNLMYNDLPAGFFAGFFSELIGVDFDSVEMSFVKENLEGIYLLADESVAMTVRRWLESGRSYDQILRSLEKKEYRKRRKRSADVKETYTAEPDEDEEE